MKATCVGVRFPPNAAARFESMGGAEFSLKCSSVQLIYPSVERDQFGFEEI